jgi:hypothetical protein
VAECYDAAIGDELEESRSTAPGSPPLPNTAPAA